jgi:hypothetical protein
MATVVNRRHIAYVIPTVDCCLVAMATAILPIAYMSQYILNIAKVSIKLCNFLTTDLLNAKSVSSIKFPTQGMIHNQICFRHRLACAPVLLHFCFQTLARYLLYLD